MSMAQPNPQEPFQDVESLRKSEQTKSPSFREIFAPDPLPAPELAAQSSSLTTLTTTTSTSISQPKLFLSGSIAMGAAVDWQAQMSTQLSHLPITILNPRRPDWDSSWKQEMTFGPFLEQVNWELDMMLEAADLVVCYLAPGTVSPITLLELGLLMGKKWSQGSRDSPSADRGVKHGVLETVLVACPEGFERRGNVQIVCERFGVRCLDSLEDLVVATEERLEHMLKKP